MPKLEKDITSINIMGREFKIKCPEDKIAELEEAARYLNNKMEDVKKGDRHITIDRIAITAALNIAHEFMSEKQKAFSQTNLQDKVFDLENKIEDIL